MPTINFRVTASNSPVKVDLMSGSTINQTLTLTDTPSNPDIYTPDFIVPLPDGGQNDTYTIFATDYIGNTTQSSIVTISGATRHVNIYQLTGQTSNYIATISGTTGEDITVTVKAQISGTTGDYEINGVKMWFDGQSIPTTFDLVSGTNPSSISLPKNITGATNLYAEYKYSTGAVLLTPTYNIEYSILTATGNTFIPIINTPNLVDDIKYTYSLFTPDLEIYQFNTYGNYGTFKLFDNAETGSTVYLEHYNTGKTHSISKPYSPSILGDNALPIQHFYNASAGKYSLHANGSEYIYPNGRTNLVTVYESPITLTTPTLTSFIETSNKSANITPIINFIRNNSNSDTIIIYEFGLSTGSTITSSYNITTNGVSIVDSTIPPYTTNNIICSGSTIPDPSYTHYVLSYNEIFHIDISRPLDSQIFITIPSNKKIIASWPRTMF